MLRDLRFKRNVSITFLLFCFLGSLQLTFAEGSKDWYPADYNHSGAGEFRACLYSGVPSSQDPNSAMPFPTNATMKVYAKAGEHIYIASSLLADASASIVWRAPDGSTGTWTNAQAKNNSNMGIIEDRTAELAGPNLPGETSGYNAYKLTVTPEQEGVWEIDFQTTKKLNFPDEGTQSSDIKVTAWKNLSDKVPFIMAFDISVSNVDDNAFISGRVYANVLNVVVPNRLDATNTKYATEWYTKYYVLTNTTYLYEVNPNGQNGHYSTFFANNKGVQENYTETLQYASSNGTAAVVSNAKSVKGGIASYESYHFGANTFPNSFVPLYDPRSPDNVKKVLNADGEYEDYYEDVTHKIFFNKPDRTMPAKAKCVYGNTVGETWLITKLNEKDTPELSNLTIAGKESNLPGVLGPEGVNIYFEANVAGEYVIDMSFGDSYVNRQFTGVCVAGPNVIEWDGKDGNGTTVPMTDISLSGKLRSAEIHFPYCDLENNKYGISLLQLNAAWTEVVRKKIYWDDTSISGGTASGADGKDSPEHKYAFDGSSIGDQSIIDTWTYAEGESQGVQHCQAKSRYIDLAIDSIACDKKVAHIGEPITYTLKVKNIYHENYDHKGMSVTVDADADSASVGIWFPNGGFYTDSVFLVSSSDPTCKVVQQPSGDEYSLGFINLTNGDSAIVKVIGYASSKLAHKEIQAEGFIMRPGDYYEVDANNINDDGMPLLPVDTVAGGNKGEYDGIPNNNLITAPEILFFLNSAPDATPDTIKVNACNTVEGSLLDNDFEIDADPMTITEYYIGENGSSVTPGTKTTVDSYGDITINADGTFSFSATKVAGSLPNIYYVVSDGFVGVSGHTVGDLIPGIDTSFMKISIKQNQLPSVAPTSATIQAGTKVEVPISFTDPKNDALTITKSGTDAAKFSIENGKLYYTGGSIDNTTTYTFNVSVSDGCNDPVVEEVSVTVKADHAPDASDATVCIQVKSGTKNTSLLLPVAFDDVDGDKVDVKITAQKINTTNVSYFSVTDGNLYYKPTNDNNSTKNTGTKEYTVKVNITSNGVTTAKTIAVNVYVKNNNGTTPSLSVTGKTVSYGTTLDNAYTATPNSSDIYIKDNNLKCYHNDDVLPVGTYNLTFTYAHNSCSSPYYFGNTATATIKVEPLPITLTSATDEQEYDGNPLENHTVTPSTTLVGDDAFTYTNFASQTEVGETENTFDVLPVGGTDLNNYNITKSYGTLTVTPVDLDADDFEIDASSKTVTYDKNAKELDFTATISDSDYDVYYKVDGVWTTTKPVEVGEYPAKVHVTGANYVNEDITSDDWKLTIEPKVVTLNWSPSNTFVFDGTEKTVTPSVNGVIEGDECNITDVTGNKATIVGTYSAEVAGLSNDNYTLSSSSFSWNITSKTINPFIPSTPKDEDYKVTVTGEGSFVYDATAKTPTVIVKVGDVVIPSTEYTVTYANNIDAGENTAKITIANATGGNYTVEGTTIYFSIAPASLTLTSANGTFTYDGTAHKNDVVTVSSGQLYGSDALAYSNFTQQITVDTVPNKFTYVANGSTKLSNYTIDTVCGNLMVTPATITLNCPAGSDITKVYDGTALNPVATVSGAYGDDVIAISYSKDNGTSWSSTVPSITNVAESPLSVKVKAENPNYKTETCSYDLTIEKATLSIAITDDKEYDGSALVSDFSKATAIGLVDGDALSAGSFTTTDVNAGNYTSDGVDFTKTAISAAFATTKGIENYNVSYDVKQSITKNETPIVITASSAKKMYNGVALSNPDYTYTEGVLKSGDVLTAVVEGTITDAGKIANKVTSYKVMQGETEVTSNYTFGTSEDGELEITKRRVSFTSATDSKTYDGSALTNSEVKVGLDSFVTGEKVIFTVTGTQTKVGNSENTFTYVFASNTKAINYEVDTVFGVLTVTNSTITLTCPKDGAETQVFNKEAFQPEASATGVNNETIKIEYSVDHAAFTETVPSLTNADTVHVDVRATAANYDTVYCSYDLSVSKVKITPAKDPENPKSDEYVIVYLDDDSTYTYNGKDQEPIIAIVVNNDTIPLTEYEVTYKDNKNASDSAKIIITNKDGGNYEIALDTVLFSIQPKMLELTWSKPTVFTYDGEPHSVVATMTGVVAGDECTLVLTDTLRTNVGNYTAKASIEGESISNYQLPKDTTLAWSIGKQVLPVDDQILTILEGASEVDDNTYTYDGTEKKPTVVVKDKSGNIIPEDEYEVTYENNVKAGTGKVIITNLEGGDYTIETSEKEFKINPKTLELTWSTETSFEYDGNAHSVVATMTGVETGDDCNLVLTDTLRTNVGNYTAKASIEGESISNYQLPKDTTLAWSIGKQVLPADDQILTILEGASEVDDNTYTYDGTSKRPTVVVKDKEGNIIPEDEYEVTYENNVKAGTGKVIITNLEGGDYTIETNEKEFKINPKTLELTWSTETSFEYDGNAHSVVATMSGVIAGDDCDLVLTDTLRTNVGNYTAEASIEGDDVANYALPSNNTLAWEITTKSVIPTEDPEHPQPGDYTIVFVDDDSTYTYNGENQEPRVILIVDGDTIPADEYVVSYKDNKNASDTAKIIITNKDGGNYEIAMDTAEFTIEPKQVELTWSAVDSFGYDGTKKGVVADVIGTVGGDDVKVISYANDSATNVGNYVAEALELDNSNYRLPEDATHEWKITATQYELAIVSEGDTLKVITVNYGDTITAEDIDINPTKEGYDFSGWEPSLPYIVVAGDTAIVAQFDIKNFNIDVDSVAKGGTAIVDVDGQAAYGDTITIEAIPSEGYHFVEWSDGNDENPRKIVVTGDTSLAPIFAPNQYELAIISEGDTLKVITVNYGDTITAEDIDVNPTKEGYNFSGWEPTLPYIVVAGDTAIVAQFDKKNFNIDVDSVAKGGTAIVDVDGEAAYGDTITIEAIPSEGYHFIEWSDGNDENPRKIVVTGDTSLAPIFAPNQYELAIVSEGDTLKVITVNYGDTITAEDIDINPTKEGYNFSGWEPSLPYIVVASDTSLVAQFDKKNFNIDVDSVAKGGTAIVDVDGEATYGDTITIEAIPSEGYHFVEWSDGNDENPRKIVVTGDTSLAPIFAPNQYELAIISEGDTLKVITVNYGDTITAEDIDINPTKEGYDFSGWEPTLPYIVVAGDTAIVAQFDKKNFNIDVDSVAKGGTAIVDVDGQAAYGDTITIEAIPSEGYHFVEWSDGNDENPRKIVVTGDTSLAPIFAPNQYELAIISEGDTLKVITVNYGDTITAEDIDVNPTKEGYNFSGWEPSLPYIVVAGDTAIVAQFDIKNFNIDVDSVAKGGTAIVDVDGEATYGDTITIEAIPSEGYHFVEWSDGNDENPRKIIVTGDTSLAPIFAPNQYELAIISEGDTLKVITVNYGDTITAEDIDVNPTKEGFDFSGWEPELPYIVVASDTSISAQFIVKKYEVVSFIVPEVGYCPETEDVIKYTLSGDGVPSEYRIVFDTVAKSERFEDTEFETIETPGVLPISIPFCDANSYKAYIQFRNVDNSVTELMEIILDVNLSNRYVVDIFSDVVSAVNTENRFYEYQWYHNDEMIEGATAPYYCEKDGLTGSYYMRVLTTDGRELRTCERVFSDSKETISLDAYPNPTVDQVSVKLSFDNGETHILTVIDDLGVMVISTTFNGQMTHLSFGSLPSGTYVINVDGLTVKELKK